MEFGGSWSRDGDHINDEDDMERGGDEGTNDKDEVGRQGGEGSDDEGERWCGKIKLEVSVR